MNYYTSPSPSNVSINGNQTTWWIPATNVGSLPVKNVKVTVAVSPVNGLQLVSFSTDTGSFNPNTGVWTIGTLNPGDANRKWLRLVTSVVDIGLAPFTVTSVISGDGVDPNNINNTLVQTVTSIPTAATAGAVDDLNKCHCGNVSCNDTPCNYGETTYVLDEDSVTNSTEYCWDEATGEYKFIPDNPYYDVTFEYSIWCDGVEISGPAKVHINKLFKNMSSFDHTLDVVCNGEIKDKDLQIIQAQNPGIPVSEFCWRVLRNSLGVITSSEQIPVEDIDTRTFYFCSEESCDIECPCVDGLPLDVVSQFPVGYKAQKGDTIVIYHIDSVCVWSFDGANWIRWSCGCQYKISQDDGNLLSLGSDNAPYLDLSSLPAGKELVSASFSGTTTKILTLTFDDATFITASFTDISTSPTYLQVNDSCSVNMSLTGAGTSANPFVISADTYYHGATPFYTNGTAGATSQTYNVSSLFLEPCPSGCNPTYSLKGYPSLVYENVTLSGVTLTYSIKSTAPSGTHPIDIERICS
jgi:hypothetical protein